MSRTIFLNGARAPFLKIANAAFSGSWQLISDATIMYCSRGSQRFAVRTEIDVAPATICSFVWEAFFRKFNKLDPNDKKKIVFGAGGAAGAVHNRAAVSSRPAAKPALAEVLLAEIPLPPARPVELIQTAGTIAVQAPGHPATEPAFAEAAQAIPLSARRPPDAAVSAVHRLARIALPKIITGAQRILPPDFSAYADMD